MISHKLEFIFNIAIKSANKRKHEFLTLESILLALLEDQVVLSIFQHLDIDVQSLEKELNTFLDETLNFSILSEAQIDELNKKQFVNDQLRNVAKNNGILYQPELSVALQRVIQRAAIHVQASGKKNINGIHLLVAFFGEKESHALFFMEKQGITRYKLIQLIAHTIDKPKTDDSPSKESESKTNPLNREQQGPAFTKGSPFNQPQKDLISEFSVNLNEKAKKNEIGPIIGRKKEILKIFEVLCRKRKNNPIIVGDPGVGKTAVIEGVAIDIVTGNAPEIMKNAVIYSIDLAMLIAGTKFRGDFEERIKQLISQFEAKKKEGIIPIIFIDEIHGLIGAGSTSSGSMDASNLLKPTLNNGSLRCIGTTTYSEYKKVFEKDTALARRFKKIDIEEPKYNDSLKILEGLKENFEEHHNVKFPKSTLVSAIKLSQRYITDLKLPDKAIDIIDEAGAKVNILAPEKRKNQISVKDIEKVVASMARIPVQSINASEKDKLKNLEEDLRMVIYGQDEAISVVTNNVLLSKANLTDSNKPIGSFLFAGPTGVGKTELAIQLSEKLSVHFERIDMSEFMEKHSVSKLIGAPPGYVGYDQLGILTEKIFKTPHCVLLLDEIEKAHPDIYNILLQIMDHGFLKDSNGRDINFRNVILIMTTNAGGKETDQKLIGFSASEQKYEISKRKKTINRFFTPEFRNRINAIVHFNPLNEQNILKVVDKFLIILENQLKEKNIYLEVDSNVKEFIAKNGYDVKLGARPIARFIDEEIKKPLASKILFEELSKGGKVFIKLENDKIIFKF
jgi:ATP-dependent Clp protease ATP-binding subunit ClpA